MKTSHVVAIALLAGFGTGAGTIQTLHAKSNPPVYFVAENVLTDPEAYRKEYQPKAAAMIKAHGGRYLAAGSATPFAGEPPKDRVVILVWDNMEQLQAWFNAPEYRELRKVGEQYAKFRNFAIPGVEQ